MSLNIVAEHRGELARHVGREFEQDDAAAAAAADRGAEQAHQILGFFLDLDVAVANDAEDAARADREARKEQVGEQLDQIFDRHEVRGFPRRSEEHTSELQSLMRISSAVFCLKKKNTKQ